MRIYLSNIRPRWQIERQEEALDKALPAWRHSSVHRDLLPPQKRRAHAWPDLAERAIMLRSTSWRTPDTAYVASLAVMAWTLSDFLSVVAALSAKGTMLVSLDSGLKIPADATPDQVAEAGRAFERACRRQHGEPGECGGDVSSRVRSEAAKARCELIRERWALPSEQHPMKALLREAHVSMSTAIKWLGQRADAQCAYAIAQATAGRNRASSRGNFTTTFLMVPDDDCRVGEIPL
jgi:hypothetical protein